MSHKLESTGLLRLGAIGAFTLVMIVFFILAPTFLSIGNLADVLQQSAILALLAFGLTVVIIGGGGNVVAGGIDLSVAANLGLSAAIYATTIKHGYGDAVAVMTTLATGIIIGLANAFAVVWLRIFPLLATLAVAKITSGLEFVLTQNTVVSANSLFLSWIAGPGPLGIPIMVYGLIITVLLVLPAVQATPGGLRLHAVGAHPEAARASGLNLSAYITGSYVISGLHAALAGILSVAYLSGTSPGTDNQMLSVVVAALLGVFFSPHLTPTIGGTLLAVLFIGLLGNGFQLVNISSYWISGVEGVLILFVVAWTTLSQREAMI
jgi:ribose transport system permease protein